MSLPTVWRNTTFSFHPTHLIRGRVPELSRDFPKAFFSHWILTLPKMVEASWLITSEKETKGLFQNPCWRWVPWGHCSQCWDEKGGFVRERLTIFRSEQLRLGGEAGFWTPHRKCGDGGGGLWAYRVLRHLKTFEAEAATWIGWGDLGPISSHRTSKKTGRTSRCGGKYLQFSCLGLAQSPHWGFLSQIPLPRKEDVTGRGRSTE